MDQVNSAIAVISRTHNFDNFDNGLMADWQKGFWERIASDSTMASTRLAIQMKVEVDYGVDTLSKCEVSQLHIQSVSHVLEISFYIIFIAQTLRQWDSVNCFSWPIR